MDGETGESMEEEEETCRGELCKSVRLPYLNKGNLLITGPTYSIWNRRATKI